jgi:hypothetical protein
MYVEPDPSMSVVLKHLTMKYRNEQPIFSRDYDSYIQTVFVYSSAQGYEEKTRMFS